MFTEHYCAPGLFDCAPGLNYLDTPVSKQNYFRNTKDKNNLAERGFGFLPLWGVFYS